MWESSFWSEENDFELVMVTENFVCTKKRWIVYLNVESECGVTKELY